MIAHFRNARQKRHSTTQLLHRRAVIGEQLESRVLLTAYAISTLANFNGTNGATPESGLVQLGNALYGTTSTGGAHGMGTVFEYNLGLALKGVSRLTTLASFDGSNGAYPEDGLTDVGGNLYCITSSPSIAEYNVAARTLITVAPLPNPLGITVGPNNGLIDIGGNLYGAVGLGGANDSGFIFECNLSTKTVTTLYSFTPNAFVGPSYSDLVDVGGNLYGTTEGQGSDKGGSIFEYNLSTHAFSTRVSFDGPNGLTPQAGLLNIGGNLYGTTWEGSNLFRFNPTTGALDTLATLSSPDGAAPIGNLADFNGNIYGTNTVGGSGAGGTIFEYNLSTNTLSALANFNGTNGSKPNGFLTDVNGVLYGTTQIGGASGTGTVFAATPLAPATIQLTSTLKNITLRLDPANPAADLEILNNGVKYKDLVLGTFWGVNVVGTSSATTSVTVDYKTAGFFQSPVSFTGAGSHNSLTILDAASPSTHDWDVNSGIMTAVNTGLQSNPSVSYNAVQNVSLTTRNSGDETLSVKNSALIGLTLPTSLTLNITTNVAVDIRANASPLTIKGTGSAASTLEGVTIGSIAPSLGGTLATIIAPITVNNVSEMIVDDSGDTANRTGAISPTSITGFGLPGSTAINYSAVGQLTVHGGAGSNTDTVTGTSAATTLYPGTSNGCSVNVKATNASLTINGNDKVDYITIGSLAPTLGGTLSAIMGPITVTNTSAYSTIALDDSGDNTSRTGTLTPSTTAGLGMGTKAVVDYTGKQLASLTIRGGKKGGTLTETGTSTTTNVIGMAVKP